MDGVVYYVFGPMHGFRTFIIIYIYMRYLIVCMEYSVVVVEMLPRHMLGKFSRDVSCDIGGYIRLFNRAPKDKDKHSVYCSLQRYISGRNIR